MTETRTISTNIAQMTSRIDENDIKNCEWKVIKSPGGGDSHIKGTGMLVGNL